MWTRNRTTRQRRRAMNTIEEMPMRRFALAALLLFASALAQAFDHNHAAWDILLRKHVKYVQNGNASRVDYTGLAKEHDKLKDILATYEKVPRAEFDGWTKPEQEAFLINAYNAFTVEKILTRYPDIKSIRDFGNLFNPAAAWKDKFFKLFG